MTLGVSWCVLRGCNICFRDCLACFDMFKGHCSSEIACFSCCKGHLRVSGFQTYACEDSGSDIPKMGMDLPKKATPPKW